MINSNINYEPPVLNTIGNANEVILGIVTKGDDLDGHCVVFDFEFAADCSESD